MNRGKKPANTGSGSPVRKGGEDVTITTAELAADIAASMGTGSLRERAAAIAVNRPGFLGDGTAAKCLARHTGHERYGLTDITADRRVIEILTKILNPTYGLILYREQVAALTLAITGHEGDDQLWVNLLRSDLDAIEAALAESGN